MNYVEKSLKHFLKRKVKITESLLVLFLITGGIVLTSEVAYGYTPPTSNAFEIEEKVSGTTYYDEFIVTNNDKTETSYGIFLKDINTDTTQSEVFEVVKNYLATKPATSEYDSIRYKSDIGTGSYEFHAYIKSGASFFELVDADGNVVQTNQIGTATTINSSTTTEGVWYKLTGTASDSPDNKGAAITNHSTADTGNTIKGDFIGNIDRDGVITNGNNLSIPIAGIIDKIEGNFIANGTHGGNGYGAINNSNGTIKEIDSTFIANIGEFGGAIHNGSGGTIDSIKGFFISNEGGAANGNGGGAIFNNGADAIIDTVNATFIENEGQYGGAIYNYKGTINNIIGTFIGNGNSSTGLGGAVINREGTITNLSGNFINNSATGGGALLQLSSNAIDDVQGNFIGNEATTNGGGAIYIYTGKINNITNSTFVGNIAETSGGAIYFRAGTQAGDIYADFINNTATTQHGGAIFLNNNSVANIIEGNFLGNSAGEDGVGNSSYGGAILSAGKVSEINGNFIGNSSNSDGGAIYVGGASEIGNINANFVSNISNNGGAGIYNNGVIAEIQGDFAYNSAKGTNVFGESVGIGAAITNNNTITSIISDFTGNIASRYGGAINNYGVEDSAGTWHGATIGSIVGNFTGNKAENEGGGAIVNWGEITNVEGSFSANEGVWGGAINNTGDGHFGTIKGEFTNNISTADAGGAILNWGHIEKIQADFIENKSNDYGGGAIFNGGMIDEIVGDFSGNISEEVGGTNGGGAVFNHGAGVIQSLVGNFAENKSTNAGGAIVNYGEISDITGSFTNNLTEALLGGGAIQNYGTMTLWANEQDMEFTGNTNANGSNAIDNLGTLTMLATTDAQIVFNDKITGSGFAGGFINIGNTENNGTVVLNNDMTGQTADVNFLNGTIEIGTSMGSNSEGYSNFFGGNFIIGEITGANTSLTNLTTFNSQNGKIEKFDTSSWTTNQILNAQIDVDLSTGEADYFDNKNAAVHLSTNLTSINVVNPIEGEKQQFLLTSHGNNTTLDSNVSIIVNDPIYIYDAKAEGIVSGDAAGISLDLARIGYQPGALVPTTSISAYNSVFTDITDRVLNKKRETTFTNSVWIDSYSSKEDIKFNGNTFENEMTITNVGFDFIRNKIKGWDEVYSIYGGYLSFEQTYSNMIINQDGYFVGMAGEFSKDNTFINVTMNIGTAEVETSTLESETFDTKSFTLAGKIHKEYKLTDKITYEPSFTIGYSNVSTDDYIPDGNVKIKTDALNMLSISPEMKIVANLKSGYSPYVAVSYNKNILSGGDITANAEILPSVELENYGELRIGVDKSFADKYEVYIEGIGTTGDKEGYGVQLGFEYKF